MEALQELFFPGSAHFEALISEIYFFIADSRNSSQIDQIAVVASREQPFWQDRFELFQSAVERITLFIYVVIDLMGVYLNIFEVI